MVTYGHYVQTSGSLASTTTAATRTSQICTYDNEKQSFYMLCTCNFHFCTFQCCSRPFNDSKRPVLQLYRRREHMVNIFNILFLSLSPNGWYQFDSQIFRIHFASIMTWNNWEIIAETRSYIFRWFSRCRRRRVCLSSLKPSTRSR